MKQRGALNPADLSRPLRDAEEVVRQFSWACPKLVQLVIDVDCVLRNEDLPESHRRVIQNAANYYNKSHLTIVDCNTRTIESRDPANITSPEGLSPTKV